MTFINVVYRHVYEWSQMRSALMTWFIEHLYIQPITTSSYKSLIGLHTLKITVTAGHIKSSMFSWSFPGNGS
jgi:hypothetical protein